MRTILLEHSKRYPRLAIDDLYKLIHQAAMGSEHALGDAGRARDRLREEIGSLVPGPDEPLLDPISPDGKIVRIHLRPFSGSNLDEEELLRAFLQTPQVFAPSTDRLLDYAGCARRLAKGGRLAFDADEVSGYFQELREGGFPAAHHSQVFRDAYRPAYRVVARELLPEAVLSAGERLSK